MRQVRGGEMLEVGGLVELGGRTREEVRWSQQGVGWWHVRQGT